MALSVGSNRISTVRSATGKHLRCPAAVASVQRTRQAVVVAAAKNNDNAPSVLTAIPAALTAACLVCSAVVPPVVHAAVPTTEVAAAGGDLTKKLIDSQGVPEAAQPKTNVPFQAPGISGSPRGAPQEQGTNLERTLKGAGRQIKQNYQDPDAAPFGVGKGPLVRDAKRMSQPSFTRSFGTGPSQVYQQSASSSRPLETVRDDPSRATDNRGVWYPLIEIFGKK